MASVRRIMAVWSLCGALVIGAGQAAAQQAATQPEATGSLAPPQQEIEQLINQLASPDAAVAAQAREKLVTMGDAARKALEAHIRAKTAAETALAQIETNQVAAPTLLSLDLTDVRPDVALAEITRLTGYEIGPQSGGPNMRQANLPSISLKADKQPFWSVLRELCQKADLTIYQSGGMERRIALMPIRQWGGPDIWKLPASSNGAFVVVATSLQRTNSVDLANPQPTIQRRLTLQLMAMAEPKVKVIQYSGNPEFEEVVDDKGNSMLPSPSRSMGRGRSTIWSMGVELPYPAANPGQKITRLRGKLRFVVQTQGQKLQIGDVLSARDKEMTAASAGGAGNSAVPKVLLKELKKTGDRSYEARILVSRNGMDPQQFQDLAGSAGFSLVDEQQREHAFNGYSRMSDNGEQRDMAIIFSSRPMVGPDGTRAATSEPVKLICELPTASREITVPFEFTDLPLP